MSTLVLSEGDSASVSRCHRVCHSTFHSSLVESVANDYHIELDTLAVSKVSATGNDGQSPQPMHRDGILRSQAASQKGEVYDIGRYDAINTNVRVMCMSKAAYRHERTRVEAVEAVAYAKNSA